MMRLFLDAETRQTEMDEHPDSSIPSSWKKNVAPHTFPMSRDNKCSVVVLFVKTRMLDKGDKNIATLSTPKTLQFIPLFSAALVPRRRGPPIPDFFCC